MLILSRKPNESVIILNENGRAARVVVTVLAVEGEKVKLGITAPREVGILRQELWQATQGQNHVAQELGSGPSNHENRREPQDEAGEE